ncbi:hypothetical protein [Dictyobacter kobayashii]|uniref:Uncharacterized protein n=1 Tax=Dictyobacter kobayashii TaxID=2014872 RepID=A0A402ADW2_9CHLR|nr:hypothetical protein [Dictyobacter kobayashii]GCE17281.1 hypothetical protein KDK_10810 [Dictyobacter kobayashii]
MTDEQKIVHFGPDTFLVNWKFANEQDIPTGDELPLHVIELLDAYQDEAKKAHAPVPTDLECYGRTLFIRSHGSGTFSWLLFTDEITLDMGYGTLQGHVFCQARFSSILLNKIGPEACIVAVEEMLAGLLGEKFHKQASEIHLCADVVGIDFSQVNPHQDFVSRVVRIRERPTVPEEDELGESLSPGQIEKLEQLVQQQREEGIVEPLITSNHRKIATIDFGSHGSQISCQIYNKVAEVKKRKKEWYYPIWQAHGWDGTSVVWRVEFRFKRKFLQRFDLNEAYEVIEQFHLLWKYATEEWLRYVDHSRPSKNVSRYPTHSAWEVIQSAYASEERLVCDEATEQALRMDLVVHDKPLEVMEQAQGVMVHDALWLEVDRLHSDIVALALALLIPPTFHRWVLVFVLLTFVEKMLYSKMSTEIHAVTVSMKEKPVEVLRELAAEQVALLSEEQRVDVVHHLSTSPFREVRSTLIERQRRIAKQKACVAAALGNLRTAVALMPLDELPGHLAHTCRVPGRTYVDLLSSMIWFVGKAYHYDKEKGRVFVEEVNKKRLAFGLLTAAEYEQEMQLYGADVTADDWLSIDRELNALRLKNASSVEPDMSA